MSKRLIAAVVILAALASTNAFASRARLLVFGTGDGGLILGDNGNMGSFYTDDAYNIFYNPAYVNDYKNFGIIEKSNYNSAYISSQDVVGTNFPPSTPAVNNTTGFGNTSGGATAEGGFVTSIFNYSFGLFMNRTDVLSDAIYAHPFDMRPIDIMIGGDQGWKWGVGVTYSSYRGTPIGGSMLSDTDVVIRVGAEINDFEPFAWYRVGGDNHFVPTGVSATNPAVVTSTGVEQNKMWAVGLKYHWGEWTPYAAIKKTQFNNETTGEIFGAGIGRNTKLTEGVKLAYSFAFFRQAASDQFGFNVANRGELNPQRSVLPINVAVEGDAASWVTLRAGLSYNLVDQIATGTAPDQTSGRIGATFHAGKVDFDWAVGKAATGGAETANATDSQNFDVSTGFFTAAAVSYHW
jgi:hypothetical protein